MKIRTLFVVAMACLIGLANADLKPSDNGAWSSPQTALQGFLVQYAPVSPPALVVYWFTYDEQGNQAWFISENIDLTQGGSEQTASLFKPICRFLTDKDVDNDDFEECTNGNPVGIVAVGGNGPNLTIRFGLFAIEGFSDECSINVTPPVRPSPLPPEIPAMFPCQGDLMLKRVFPAIPQIE